MTKNPITGLVHVMGEPDTGKTTFALTTGYPIDEVAFIDDDIKGQTIAQSITSQNKKFALYRNLVKESAGMRETEMHELGLRIIEELEKRKPSVVVWDTWTRFENTLQPCVARNPQAFRESYSPRGTIKGAEIWKASFDYETQLIDRLLNCAQMVILTTHLKEQSINEVRTGKEIPDAKKPLIQKSSFRIWLRHNPDSPAPIGLVLKRLSKVQVNADGEMEVVSVLPRRIAPGTWKNIKRYWDEPVGDRPLTNDEKPNEFELSILDGVLTADQKDVLRLNVFEREKETAEIKHKKTEAKRLAADGQSPRLIAEALGVEIGTAIEWINN